MATTPKTVRTYALDGTKKDFTIPFEYLARKFVVVALIGATRRELILNTEYRFTTNTTITTNKAWGPADNFDLIEIRRLTSATERLVDFADGSILRAYDLNISQVQSLHIAEEARDLTADTIGVNNDGDLDARARKIVNLADGVNDGDAVNLRQQKQWAGSALNQAQASAASASQSAQSAANSQASAVNSASSASSAATSATNSASSASNSATQRAASEAAKTASETARDLSQAWASKAEDSVVSGGLYSSYHYSRKSAASAAASQTSATNSASSASFATTEANRATTQADRAKTEADKLANANAFMGTIDVASDTEVAWKSGITLKAKVIWVDSIYGRTTDKVVIAANQAETAGQLKVGNGLVLTKGGATLNGDILANNNLSVMGGIQCANNIRSNSGYIQSYAASDASNCHVWFCNTNGSTRGILYADPSGWLRLQAGNALAATFKSDGGVVFNGVNCQGIDSSSTIYSKKSGGGIGADMHKNSHFQAQTSDGTPPSYAFHRGGSYALALYLTGGNQLNMMDSAGANREIVNSGNIAGWLVAVGQEGVGSYAMCRAGATATYGIDLSGANISYGSTGAGGGTPPGTWRSRGWAGGGQHTVFQRVA